jgi:hypothetical protein
MSNATTETNIQNINTAKKAPAKKAPAKKAAAKKAAPAQAKTKRPTKKVGAESPRKATKKPSPFQVRYVTGGNMTGLVDGSVYGEWIVEYQGPRAKTFKRVGIVTMITEAGRVSSGRKVTTGYTAHLVNGKKVESIGVSMIEDEALKTWPAAKRKALKLVQEAVTAA